MSKHKYLGSNRKTSLLVIKEKIYAMVEVVIATTMADKLNPKMEEHPTRYKLSWFSKGCDLKVNKRCLKQFSTGKMYQDEVWCRVMPMDACHLLPGRTLVYDHKAKHDDLKNTYTFKKDSITITLELSYVKQDSKEKGNHLISKSEIGKVIEESAQDFAINSTKLANQVAMKRGLELLMTQLHHLSMLKRLFPKLDKSLIGKSIRCKL